MPRSSAPTNPAPASELIRLDGRVVVVTGAGAGIGLAMTDVFLEAGARVLAVDFSEAALASLLGRERVDTLLADMSSGADVDRMIDYAVEHLGTVDILCNNAPGRDSWNGVAETTDDDWNRVLAINLTAPFRAIRRALPHMLRAGHGVILNTISVAGMRGGVSSPAYTASKHGLVGLTRNVAAAYGADGIRCVAICPGGVASPSNQRMRAAIEQGEIGGRILDMARRTGGAVLRRADPREIAMVALLMTSDAGSILNGAILPADAGWTAH